MCDVWKREGRMQGVVREERRTEGSREGRDEREFGERRRER